MSGNGSNDDLANRLMDFLKTEQQNKIKVEETPKVQEKHQRQIETRELKEHYRYNKNKTLQIHIQQNIKNGVGAVRKKLYDQDFTWKGRAYPIDHQSIIYDNKGVGHLFYDANTSDGVIRLLSPAQLNLIDTNTQCDKCHRLAPLDKCNKCGGAITYDARNVRDLIKRKTLTTFWGLDQSHILLLLVMGIVMIGAFGGMMYILGENQKINQAYTKLLEANAKQTVITPNSSDGNNGGVIDN